MKLTEEQKDFVTTLFAACIMLALAGMGAFLLLTAIHQLIRGNS